MAYVNPSFASIFGYTPEEIIGKISPQDLIHRDDVPFLNKNLKARYAGEGQNEGQVYKGLRKDGAIVFIEALGALTNYLGKPALLGSTIDITKRKRAEKALEKSNEELKAKHAAVEEKNIALKEVLSQIEDDKKHIASQIQSNIDRIVMPVLRRLTEKVGPTEKEDVSLVQNSLEEITNPFVSKLETLYGKLTPKEVEICNMIRNGQGTKDIALALNTSWHTVRNQRQQIRKKLAIAGQKTNLTTILRKT